MPTDRELTAVEIGKLAKALDELTHRFEPLHRLAKERGVSREQMQALLEVGDIPFAMLVPAGGSDPVPHCTRRAFDAAMTARMRIKHRSAGTTVETLFTK